MNIDSCLSALVEYGIERGLIEACDRIYTVNRLLEALELDSYTPEPPAELPLEDILKALLDDAVARGVCEGDVTSRDLLDTKLMGALTEAFPARPSCRGIRSHS